MKYNVCCFDIIRRITRIQRHKNGVLTDIRSCFTTLSENKTNYYDILDKRDLTESSGFEKNDHRKSWTNRDDSTNELYVDKYEQVQPAQRVVATYRNCKVTNLRSKVSTPIASMDGDELISGICYNILGIEEEMSIESLYSYLRNLNINKCIRSLGSDKYILLDDFKVQVERLLHHRKLSMEQAVKVLLLYDKLNFLSHELRNLIQSHMYLNIHAFTQFQVIATFEVFGKHKERYENFLNLLCLIFYDQMIPLMRSKEALSSPSELRNVLDFLRVLKDFNFKKLTDVLYSHVYDNVDLLSVDQMVQVSNTFFSNKKDPNFVELYTGMLSKIFKIPLLDLYNFESYVQRMLEVTSSDNFEPTTTVCVSGISDTDGSNILLDHIDVLKALFGCNSEFLLSSVHHRIEFKRLWRYNIKTNNVSWRLPTASKGRESDNKKLDFDSRGNEGLLTSSQPGSAVEGKVTGSVDGSIAVNGVSSKVSYIVNFETLYEKIEHLILNKFKFQSYPRDYICNIIATVLDYSRYSVSTGGAYSILTNLYALLINLRGRPENMLEELKLISPKTLLDHSHVYFYKIDPECEFYKNNHLNYYKPHLTTYSLLGGDHRLYSLLMKAYSMYMLELPESGTKNDHLSLCKLIENVLHPFYCSMRVSEKPFLSLDMLHMRGDLNKKCVGDFGEIARECMTNIQKSLSDGLLPDLLSFTELATKRVTTMLSEDFTANERVKVLKTLSAINICNNELDQGPEVKDCVDSTVDELLSYFRADDKEDIEDGVTVGQDLRLFNYISDLLTLGSSDRIYELLRENLKIIYNRMNYYNLEELITLSSCILSSLNHFSTLDLEGHEALESLSHTLKILKKDTVDKFYAKSATEEHFNPKTANIYNILMMYHIF